MCIDLGTADDKYQYIYIYIFILFFYGQHRERCAHRLEDYLRARSVKYVVCMYVCIFVFLCTLYRFARDHRAKKYRAFAAALYLMYNLVSVNINYNVIFSTIINSR